MAAPGAGASGEDALIARYFRPLATDPGAFNLLDDAAILKATGEDLVVTSDALEGIRHRAGAIAQVCALADLAQGFQGELIHNLIRLIDA